MSEDIPEKVEDQPEEAAAKKKSARKRARSSEPRAREDTRPAEEDDAGSDRAAEPPEAGKTAASEQVSSNDKPSGDGDRPPLEDGETPTENPSVRRISSKRMTDSKASEGDDSPDEIPTIVEPPASDAQGKKRRRRRRKGPGGESDEGASDEGRQQSRSSSRVQLDPEAVTKKAWKIFLSEVSEEGLALVSDQDAKEIGRRSFRLAEIFLEEAAKRQ